MTSFLLLVLSISIIILCFLIWKMGHAILDLRSDVLSNKIFTGTRMQSLYSELESLKNENRYIYQRISELGAQLYDFNRRQNIDYDEIESIKKELKWNKKDSKRTIQ